MRFSSTPPVCAKPLVKPVRHLLPVPTLLRIDGHGADGEVTGLARVRVGFPAEIHPQGVLACASLIAQATIDVLMERFEVEDKVIA